MGDDDEDDDENDDNNNQKKVPGEARRYNSRWIKKKPKSESSN